MNFLELAKERYSVRKMKLIIKFISKIDKYLQKTTIYNIIILVML